MEGLPTESASASVPLLRKEALGWPEHRSAVLLGPETGRDGKLDPLA